MNTRQALALAVIAIASFATGIVVVRTIFYLMEVAK
jgi:hypothetical protein